MIYWEGSETSIICYIILINKIYLHVDFHLDSQWHYYLLIYFELSVNKNNSKSFLWSELWKTILFIYNFIYNFITIGTDHRSENNFVESSKLIRRILKLACQNFCSTAYHVWDSYEIILIIQQNYFQIYIQLNFFSSANSFVLFNTITVQLQYSNW